MATVFMDAPRAAPLTPNATPAFDPSATGDETAFSPSATRRDTAGENNVNSKLTDAAIRAMRQARFESLQPQRIETGEHGTALAEPLPLDWPELGARFGVHPKTAYRVCLGKVRAAAGGPIEDGIRPCKEEIQRNFIRCRSCGGKHQRFEECQRCQTLWAGLIAKMLTPFGRWVDSAAA